MNYGTAIDSYDPRNEDVYTVICKYFNNPMLTKIKEVEGEGYSMYAAEAKCGLGLHTRYIVVLIVQDSSPVGTVQLLDKLKWISFQTRTLLEKFNISNSFQYTPSRNPSNKINIILREEKHCKYICEDFQVNVTLITEDWEPKQNTQTYQKTGTLSQAIETWKTIITFV